MTIRVVVVDDHPVFRLGLAALLDSLEGVRVVGQAASAVEARALLGLADEGSARTTGADAPDGLGRMNAAVFWLSSSIRVLSPRIDPPVTDDEGSTASTATRRPLSIRYSPSASMNVDLPTPGTPEMPTRIAPPVDGSSASMTRCARA